MNMIIVVYIDVNVSIVLYSAKAKQAVRSKRDSRNAFMQ
jgi:hypothetical protein